MSRKFRYIEEFDVLLLCHRLAIAIFPGYEAETATPSSRLFAQVLNYEALSASVQAPRQPYYRTTDDKAAALLRSMVKNHPFADGNKRLGLASMWMFLLFNKRVFFASNEEMVQFAVKLAESQPAMDWREVARWIRRYSSGVQTPAATTIQRGVLDSSRMVELRTRFDVSVAVFREVDELLR